MKYTKFLLVHFCTLLVFAACSKEEQSTLNIEASGKVNKYEGEFKAKDFRLKTIKNTITYPPSLSPTPVEETYELIYNHRGEIERINITTRQGDFFWEYYYLAHFKGARMDSISGHSISGAGLLFSGIQYKGTHIVEVWFHSGFREPEKKLFEYDNKGRLLNGMNRLGFIYDEKGLLVKIDYPIDYYDAFFYYERALNPLFISNIYLFLPFGNLNELCYSQWNIATKKQGEQIITHRNSYDERGRLKTKNYTEGIAAFQIEFSYY